MQVHIQGYARQEEIGLRFSQPVGVSCSVPGTEEQALNVQRNPLRQCTELAGWTSAPQPPRPLPAAQFLMRPGYQYWPPLTWQQRGLAKRVRLNPRNL